MEITFVIVGGILAGCFLGLSWFAGSDAPYVPTKNERIKKLLKTVGLKKGDKFWELGSGDGRIVLEAAKLGADATGIEQSLIRVLWSRYQAKKLASHMECGNVEFIHGNIFSHLSFPRKRESINTADVVYIFLLPKGVEKLELILQKKLKKNSRVITQTFHFKNWIPIKKILVTDKKSPNTPLGKNVVEGNFWIYKV